MNDPQNQTPNSQSEPKPLFTHGRTGKVARLPKAVRDRICQLMLDGHTYLQIIEELGDDGKALNEDNLSSWKSGGYLDWRREEKELAEIQTRQENAADVGRATEGTSLCEATRKMLIAQILDALRDTGTTSLQNALAEKPETYVRLLHAVARLSVGAISCERHRLNEASRKASLEKEQARPGDRSISASTVATVEELLRTH